MDSEIKVWLYDIYQAIEEIESYFDEKSMHFQHYITDIKTRRAVERDLEIIGEAVNRIIKEDKNFRIENAQKIIGTRNRIIHGYDTISDDLIWSIVVNHLPKLKNEIKGLMENLP